MVADAPDWIDLALWVSVVTSADNPDWTRQVLTVPTGSPADAPDWTETMVLAPGSTGGGGGGGALPPTGYLAWYDATQIVGVADGASLASWPDMSGNHYDLAQATGANQPTFYSSTAAQLINGHPAVRFDGTASFMVASGFPNTSPPYTIFVVSLTPVTTTQIILMTAGLYPQVYYALGDFFMSNGSAVGDGGTGTNAHAIGALINDPNSFLYVDGAVGAGPTTAGANSSTGALTVGRSTILTTQFLNGAIGEIIWYSSALSAAQLTTVRHYLAAKWGTP